MQDRIELTEYRTPYSKRFLKRNGDIQIEIYSIPTEKRDSSKKKTRNSYNPSTIGLVDTYIFNGDGNTSTYNQGKLLVGTDSSKSYRTLIKFNLPTLPTNYRMVNARLFLVNNPISGANPLYIGPKIVLHKINTSWSESTAKWANMNDKYEAKIYDYICTTRSSSLPTSQEIKIMKKTEGFNITSIVQDWYNGETNNGVMIKWNDETYNSSNPIAEFISKDGTQGTDYLPTLILDYKNYNGIEPYLSYTSQQHHFGESHICNYTGNLTSTFDVGNTIGGPMPIHLYLVYNTGSVVLNEDYGYGLGFKLNMNQKLTLVNDSEEQNITNIIYTDEDGTEHLFKENNNIYYDEDGLSLKIELNNNCYIMKDKNGNESKFELYNNVYYLTQIKDTNGKEINIEFDNSHRINRVLDSNNNYVSITYNTNSVLFTSPHKTTSINLTSNLLTSIVSLGDTETITYTNDNLIEKITDPNGLAIKYEYINNLTSKVSKVSELSTQNNIGNYLTFVYSVDDTKITDNKGRLNTLTFNEYGNTINITNLDDDDDLSNAYGKSYVFGDESNTKNKITVDKSLIRHVDNLIEDSSFENENDRFTTSESITKTYVSDARTGAKAAKFTVDSSPSVEPKIFNSFYVDWIEEPVTLSFFAKGNGSANLSLSGSMSIEREDEIINLTNEYKRYSITYDLSENQSTRLNLVINDINFTEMTMDDVQLEVGEVANYYNIIDASSLELSPTGWNITSTGQTNTQNTTEDGNNCLKIHSDPDGSITLEKSFNTSGSAGDVFNLSFWYKNYGILPSGYSFGVGGNGINATIFFEYENEEDGVCVPYKAFNNGTNNWQFFSENFVAEYDYTNISIIIMSDKNANDTFLTNFSLFKDLTAYSYNYDENGNLVSSTSLSKEQSTMFYDKNNQLLSMMNPKGANYKFEYDNNITNRLLKSLSPTGITNEIKYDSNSNPIRTRINNRATLDELNDNNIYYIRQKGTDKYFFVNYDKRILLRESECSYSIFNIVRNGDYYTIRHKILNNYYLVFSNNELKLQYRNIISDDMLFDLVQDTNGWYTLQLKNTNPEHTSNKYIKVNTSNELELDEYDLDEEYRYQFYFEQFNRKLYIEANAEYSSDGRFITSVTDSLDKTSSYNMNSTNGLINSYSNSDNVNTNYTYDSKFRITNISKDSQSVSYEYTNNNLSKITYGTKNYLFNYDEFNNTTSIAINNNTLINNYFENNNGNLTRVLYGNNNEVNYTYDSYDRLKTITKSNDVYNNYYDNLGRITKLISNSDVYKYNYDFASRLSKYNYNDYETTYDYDKNNNVITKNEKLKNYNYTYNYDYNNENVLTKLTINNINFNYDYDNLGRLISSNINNHCNINYEYITHGNKTSLVVNKIIDGNDTYEYSYDNLYNITEIKKNDTLTNKYYYDNHSQLTREDNLIDNITINYIYDNYGNILSKKTYTYNTTTLLDEDTYEYNNSNWQDLLTKFNNENITYDNIGNPLTIGNKTFTWMNGRELATYSDGTNNISYKYNLNGIRTSKTVNNTTTNYYIKGKTIIFEEKNGVTIHYIYNGVDLIGFVYNNNMYFYHKNTVGDIIGIYDSNYSEIVTYEYDSWGMVKRISDNSNINLGLINPFRYKSYYYDEETGFYYLNTRYYCPVYKRMLNSDSVLSYLGNMVTLNLFSYCNNNPINESDDSGCLSISWKKVKKAVGKTINTAKKVVKEVGTKAITVTKNTYNIAKAKVNSGISYLTKGVQNILGYSNKTKTLKTTTTYGGTAPYIGGLEVGKRDSLLHTNTYNEGIISANITTSTSSIDGKISVGPINAGIGFDTNEKIGISAGIGLNDVSGGASISITNDFRLEIEVTGSGEYNKDTETYEREYYANGSVSVIVPIVVIICGLELPALGLAALFA